MSGRTEHLAVVRRGDMKVFRRLQERFAKRSVRIIWDRRIRERRTTTERTGTTERRRSDRRRQPPDTWDAMGFVLTAQDGGLSGGTP